MRSAGYILSGAAGMPLNITSSENYYKEHQNRINRTSIINGKVSYDLDQNKMLNDVMELGKNAFTGTVKGLYAITQNDYESFKKVEEEDFVKADEYKNRINEELSNETSGFQSFIAGVPIHMLRQLVDVRQYPGLILANSLGGTIGTKVANSIGTTTKAGRIIGKTVGNAVEEFTEEVSDQLITDGELDWLGLLTATTSGAGLSLLGSAVKGEFRGSKKTTADIKAKAKAEADIKAEEFKNKAVEIGENKAKVEDANVIAEGVSVIADAKGKYVNPEKIKEAGITMNGVTIQTAKDIYLPRIISYVLQNKKIKGIENAYDFLHSASDEAKFNEVVKIIKETAKLENISPEEKEAFSWFSEFIDRERVKRIDVDASKLKEEALKNLYERQGYVPIYKDPHIIEPGYPYLYTELDSKSFTAVSKAKGKRVSDKATISKLKEDLYIPEKSVVKVTQNGDEISISWEEEGYKKFAKVKDVDGKYRGNVYRNKVNIPQKTKGKGKIKDRPKPPEKEFFSHPQPEIYPTNIMEDIFGRYELDLKKLENVDMVIDVVKKRFGLNTKINSKTPRSYIGSAYREMVKYVGKIERETFNFLNIEEAVEFYKNEYGLDFDFILTDDLDGSYGRTTRVLNPDTGEAKYTVQISSTLGEDTAIGTLKHEIQHMIDFKDNPDFKSKPVYPISKKRAENIIDYLDQTTGHHFEGVDGNYEFQYIVAHDIDNFVKNGKLDRTIITSYNMDIPDGKDLTTTGIEFIEDTINGTKGITDAMQRLAETKKRVDKYYKARRGFKRVLQYKVKDIPYVLKEYLNNTIIRPFKKVEEQVQSSILKCFEVEIDGNMYDGESFMKWYKDNGGNFMDYVAFDSKIPDKLAPYTQQIEQVKSNLLKLVDGLTEDGLVTREQALFSIIYNEREIVENLLTDAEKADFMNSKGEFNLEKFNEGDLVTDDLIIDKNGEPVSVPKRIMNIRDRFSDANYKYFANAVQSLETLLARGDIDSKILIRRIREARKCMKTEDFINLLKKYNVEEIPEIKEFLEKHPKLFEDIKDNDIKANIIKSQKNNAKRFFTLDMASHKGTFHNSNFGTYAHKISRFNHFTEQGIISNEGLASLIKANKGRPETAMTKLYRDISAAYAIKEIFPGVGYNDFARMMNDVQGSVLNRDVKTYITDAERIIDGEIGQKLGRITKAPRTKLDDVVDGLLKWSNAVNLTGVKAFKEFFQETPSMARESVLRYGGPGLIDTYKFLLKSLALIKRQGDLMKKINKAIGTHWENEMPTGYYNVILEDMDDPFGAKKTRIMEKGDRVSKVFYHVSNGFDKLNLYGTTQRFLKLTAYFLGGENLNGKLSYGSLEEALEKSPATFKRLIQNLDISDTDFELMKGIKELPLFKEAHILDKVEFYDSLTPQKLSQVLGRELSEEEFEILRKEISEKAYNLYNNIVSDVSPTEPEGIGKTFVGTQSDPINRNFNKLTTNFKSSIQVGWGRMIGSYKYANITKNGYDWSNVPHQKRLLKHMLEVGAGLAIASTAFDLDFYADPEAELERRIDDLVDNPGSVLWAGMQEYFNSWGATTGANSLRRPMAIMGQIASGDLEKTPDTAFKWVVGTDNAKFLKSAYELTR